jgi:anthraniloyl-CoA monooxygenase
MESAISLSDAIIANPNDIQAAFQNYDKSRRNIVEMIQYAANVSLDWFENMDRHIQHPFYQFAFGCMTRSKKVTYENLQIRDKSFTDKVLKEFNDSCHTELVELPAAFSTFKLRGLVLQNRIVMSPMGQYSAENGLVNDWHFQHYTSRAIGGLGLILTEMTAVSDTGRITLGCTGIYNENQIVEWKRINDFIHKNTQTKIGIQLGHSGRKGATKKPWETEDLKDKWELLSASPIPFNETSPTPKEMTLDELNLITTQFVKATKNADKAGFDMIELQAHHGFLLASFLSPLTNIRKDQFGGSIENRLKFPLRVFNDIINVSTGNTVVNQKPQTGRMWQTPFSDTVRNTINVPTITTGYIQDIDQINTIILNGRADLVALGRPLLLDPNFVRNAQAHENFRSEDIPNQYKMGISHLYPLKASERKQAKGMKKALKPKSNKI